MILIISGPQASGKGTQAKLIAKELGLFHVESGKMLREMAETDKRIKDLINKGILIPDKETLEYIERYIKKNNRSFDNIIFDGYPRTISQYKLMKKWLGLKGKSVYKVIYLQISDNEAVERLSARRVCSKCGSIYNLITNPPSGTNCRCGSELKQRQDDEPKAIEKRLATFHQKTETMLKEIRHDGILLIIDGERPIEVIFKDILKKLKK